MPIKRLSYPGEDKRPNGDRGVDIRLGEAHIHGNGTEDGSQGTLSVLDQITQSDIDAIREKLLDRNLENITDAGKKVITDYLDSKNYLQKPNPLKSNVNYVYTSEGWKDATNQSIAKISVDDATYLKLTSDSDDANKFSIDLTSTTKAAIDDVKNKVDIVTGTVDNIILFGSGGALKDSNTNLTSLEKVANKSSAVDSDSETTYATSKAVKTVNDKLDKAIESIGKLRGVVYNAFTSQGMSYTLTSIDVEFGGYSFSEGDRFGVNGVCDAELLAHVDNNGTVTSFDIINGGMFSEEETSLTVYPKSNTNVVDNERSVRVENPIYEYVMNSTLRDIEDCQNGDTCYVNYDELHNYERSMYTYKTSTLEESQGWVYTACVAATPKVSVLTYAPTDIATMMYDQTTQSIVIKWEEPYSNYGNMSYMVTLLSVPTATIVTPSEYPFISAESISTYASDDAGFVDGSVIVKDNVTARYTWTRNDAASGALIKEYDKSSSTYTYVSSNSSVWNQIISHYFDNNKIMHLSVTKPNGDSVMSGASPIYNKSSRDALVFSKSS